MDNIYYNSETPYYDTPNPDKFESITNISQIPNHYIKQPNSNEFIIKCDKNFWGSLITFLTTSGIIALLICCLIYDWGEYSYGGVIFAICFFGLFACLGLVLCLCYTIREKVILTEDYIQITNYHILFCLNRNKIYNYKYIKSFEVDIREVDEGGDLVRKIFIACLDNSIDKNYFFAHDFELEDAQYFVYVVNGFINKKKLLKNIN